MWETIFYYTYKKKKKMKTISFLILTHNYPYKRMVQYVLLNWISIITKEHTIQ